MVILEPQEIFSGQVEVPKWYSQGDWVSFQPCTLFSVSSVLYLFSPVLPKTFPCGEDDGSKKISLSLIMNLISHIMKAMNLNNKRDFDFYCPRKILYFL
jgi:hypothetical protein